ncbi:hypothetical protein F5X97DRAFT_93450 [Nemania serpens]|nr:hypothetical protein F5X97DRAFT_93450 [Nemania serpens]
MFPLTLPSFFFVSLACPYMWSLGENVRLARTSTLLGLDIISAAAVDRNLINWLPSVASIIAVEVIREAAARKRQSFERCSLCLSAISCLRIHLGLRALVTCMLQPIPRPTDTKSSKARKPPRHCQ